VEDSRAKALRDAWKSQGDPPCPHTKLDAESTASGYFTGQYVCKACGEYVPMGHHPSTNGPQEKIRASRGRYALYTSMGLLAAAVPFLTVWYKRRRRNPE
jgi:hypothetical protein